MPNEIEALIDSAWEAVVERRDVRNASRIERPPFEELEARRLESRFDRDLPVLAHLDAALELAQRHELSRLAEAMRAVVPRLDWSQNPGYDEARVGRSLLDGYAYAGLAGPDCPVQCELPRCGFLLLGPGVTYVDHRHGPREIYLLMTPGSQWRLDRGEWFDVDAGDLVFHAAWQAHAMRAGRHPMLAFVAWLDRGDRGRIRF